MSSMISFFMSFYVDSSDDKVKFGRFIRSNPGQYATDLEF